MEIGDLALLLIDLKSWDSPVMGLPSTLDEIRDCVIFIDRKN